MKFWCNNCKHLLPLLNNKRTSDWKQWWAKNRKQFEEMHRNGDCDTKKHQLMKIEK
jgi:hypothetical protein